MHAVQQQPETAPRLGLWPLFRIWAIIGLQSFGGGATTIFLIQNEFIEKRKLLTAEEFLHFWNLCVMVPGINLIALTILMGRKLGGVGGIAVSLLGMLLPSATITCLITAVFQGIEKLPATQAALKGIIPATGGVMLLVGLNFSRPQIKLARQGGVFAIVVSVLIILLCILAIVLFNLSAILILPCAGLLGIFFFTYIFKPQPAREGAVK